MNFDWGALVSTYQQAYLAAALIALGCAVVGVYVVLCRVSFVGIATAQISAAGVALAFLIHFSPLPAAILSALAGVSLFAFSKEPKRVTRDSLIGAAFALSTALAVLFVSRSGAELDQVEHIIYGTLLFATPGQVQVLAVGTALVLLLHLVFHREFLMVSFDPESARTLGVRTRLFNLLLFLSLGVVIALSIGTAGSLLAFAFLILPPMTGLLLSDRMGRVFALSMAAALVTAVGGVLAAILFDVPTGPAIVVAASALLLSAGAARLHALAGLATLATVILVPVLMLSQAEPSKAGESSGTATHIDLALEVHDRSIRRGQPLQVDYRLRLMGDTPEPLFLLIDAGDAVGVQQLLQVSSRTAGRLLLPTDELEPGRYTLSGSLWTGNPLEPDADTELLPPEVCSARQATVEILP